MKKKLFYLCALICSMGLFTACGSDDDDVRYPVDEELAGAYKGSLDIYYEGIKDPIAEDLIQKVYISKASDSAIKLELRDFSVTVANAEIPIGTITIDKCTLKQNGDIYEFTGSQALDIVVGKCNVQVTGTIGGGLVKMNISVDAVDAGLKVRVELGGSKLKGNENSEAKITKFTLDAAVITDAPTIYQEEGKIVFGVKEGATADELKGLVPVIEISEKATITPAIGTALDFSNNKSVALTVVAEDGTVKKYVAYASTMKFSFEEWKNVPGNAYMNEYDMPQPTGLLATSAEGASMLKMYGITEMPVFKTTDKKEGAYAIKLVTVDTSEQANALVPAITSGSLFTGKFDLNFLNWETGDKLDCTRFGISYSQKPLRFKGSYKYTPGPKFIDGTDYENIIEVKDKKDECSIQAVLFKVDADDEVLTGNDINSSEKRVAIAALSDGTAKDKYTNFDIEFEYLPGKSYETGAKYKLAIVCSSSKEGDLFKGAGGSTLILDELEVVGK